MSSKLNLFLAMYSFMNDEIIEHEDTQEGGVVQEIKFELYENKNDNIIHYHNYYHSCVFGLFNDHTCSI